VSDSSRSDARRPSPESLLSTKLAELWLERGGSSQRALANETDLSVSTVNSALRGLSRPTWPVIESLVAALGGNLDYFRQLYELQQAWDNGLLDRARNIASDLDIVLPESSHNVRSGRVYVSWSGQTGRRLAGLLGQWIPDVIQAVSLQISSDDIPIGERWINTLTDSIRQGDTALVCVTRDSVNQPWLNFEVGALSGQSVPVVPILLDLYPSDLTGPLAYFQAVQATDKEGMRRLLQRINDHTSLPLSPQTLDRSVERAWPYFETETKRLLNESAPERPRAMADVLQEILERLNRIEHASGIHGINESSQSESS
jgi:transcriptional regulator with XRE-family HTH domain